MTRICIDDGEVIVYKGYQIREAIEPWAKYFGYHWEWFSDGEKLHLEETLEDCYLNIDEYEND